MRPYESRRDIRRSAPDILSGAARGDCLVWLSTTITPNRAGASIGNRLEAAAERLELGGHRPDRLQDRRLGCPLALLGGLDDRVVLVDAGQLREDDDLLALGSISQARDHDRADPIVL